MARDSPHQRRGNGDAGGGGDEIVNRQRHHLGEIRHGGFAAVALPVGVGGEADRRIERQVGAQRPKRLRVQRKQMLQAQDRVSKEAAHQAENQHGNGVSFPALLPGRIDAQDAVAQPLNGPKHRIEPRPAAGVKNPH